MGARGPNKTPKKVLQLKNSWRGKEAPDDPNEESGAPVKPEDLSIQADKYWNGFVDKLLSMGVLATVDGDMLALMCETKAEYVVARDVCYSRGIIGTNSSGADCIEPAVKVRDAASVRLKALYREFGLSPSARASVTKIESTTGSSDKRSLLDA